VVEGSRVSRSGPVFDRACPHKSSSCAGGKKRSQNPGKTSTSGQPGCFCQKRPRRDFMNAMGFLNVRLSGRDAWLATTIAALFNTLGMLLEVAIMRRVPGVPTRPALISAVVGLVLLLVLFIRRRSPSLRLASAIQLINNASVVTFLLITNSQFALLERN